MDEGMAVFLPIGVQERLGDANYDPHLRYVYRYMNHIGTSLDVPIITNSFELKESYANASYFKAACAYEVLQNILGKELFANALREFMRRWNGKHPSPYDFFYTFENVTGQNLSWFWKPWWFEYGVPDLAIQNVSQTGDILTVTIEKAGLLPVPINLKAFGYTDIMYTDYKSANVWKDGDKQTTVEINVKGPIYQVELGSKYIPDADTTNNYWYGR
jgi:aminopeptidase N